jgi:hypothetical protein
MRFLIAGLALALTTAAAQAQMGAPGVPAGGGIGGAADAQRQKGAKSDEQKVKANEKAYNAALQNLPNKQYDPWQGVR